MTTDRFGSLRTDNAPGQERDPVTSQQHDDVDFSHGDVDAFVPSPGALEAFSAGFAKGGSIAYSEYRGHQFVREQVAGRIAQFTGTAVDADHGLIITPGTQSALFLALASLIEPKDRVVIVEPDYFANRKIVSYLGAVAHPVRLEFEDSQATATLNLDMLQAALGRGARVVVLSNPNNPTGAVLGRDQLNQLVALSNGVGATVVVDQLYSRLIYPGRTFVHLRSLDIDPARCVTLLGPSKTESLSGFRLGVAVGPPEVVERMERLLAITSLRAPGYCQNVLTVWLNEPEGWLMTRIAQHQAIRDDLLELLDGSDGFWARPTEAGSYLFPRLPPLSVDPMSFVRDLRIHAGVTVTPGVEFGVGFDNYFRVNFSQDRRRAVRALRRLVNAAEMHRR